jgi:hypothetical protein
MVLGKEIFLEIFLEIFFGDFLGTAGRGLVAQSGEGLVAEHALRPANLSIVVFVQLRDIRYCVGQSQLLAAWRNHASVPSRIAAWRRP